MSYIFYFYFQLHVTLNQQPTNLTYMRQHIHTLELISADYFIFPRLVYPCPNLESLNIEKPTNDVFNIDAQNVPFLYGNTVPFINLKHLKMSRISLTNLSHFLSKSSNLKRFKVNTKEENCVRNESENFGQKTFSLSMWSNYPYSIREILVMSQIESI